MTSKQPQDLELLRRAARLAGLDPEAVCADEVQLGSILTAFQSLAEWDSEAGASHGSAELGEEAPVSQIELPRPLPRGDHARTELAAKSRSAAKILANAPRTRDGYFSVPKTVHRPEGDPQKDTPEQTGHDLPPEANP